MKPSRPWRRAASVLGLLWAVSLPAAAAEEGGATAAWLKAHGHALKAPKSRSTADLRFLKPLLADRRIVMLGENGHGVNELQQVMARLVRFLHEEMGFNVLAFESSFYQCARADGMAGSGDPAITMTGCVYGIWHTEPVHRLFRYVRSTRDTDRPLRLAGIDIQPMGWNKRGRPAMLREVVMQADPEYAEAVLALDQEFIREYEKGSAARREYLRREGARMMGAYQRLARFLEENAAALDRAFAGTGREKDPLIARRTAENMALYIRQQSLPPHGKESVETRGRAMADNLDVILEQLHPGEKVIVWGHGFHVRRNQQAIEPREGLYPGVRVRTMGSWVAERHGEEAYAIGLFAGSGRAADSSGKPFEIAPPPPGSLEAILAGAGAGLLFVDLAGAEREPGSEWIFTRVEARENGTDPYDLIPGDQFDGLLFVAEAEPREPYP